MKIGLVQMPIIRDKEENLKTAVEGIRKAAEQGAEIVALPEMFVSPFIIEYFPDFAEEKGGHIYQTLANAAKENGVTVVGGSMPERLGDKLYNSSFVFNPEGEEIANHHKVHLYDVDIEGGPVMRESDGFGFGDKVTTFEVGGHKFGLVICFDVRYPELFRILALKGVEAVFVPAAFNTVTGALHWELLFRMRAVDNQYFTIGIAPSYDPTHDYVAYGHSIVSSPWGKVLLDAGTEPCVSVIDLDLSEVAKIREQLPLLKLRRPAVYAAEMENL